MSGRRSTGLASAVNTLSALMANDIQEKQRRRRVAEEIAQKLQIKAIERQIESGALSIDLNTGQLVPGTATPFDPASQGMTAKSYKDPVTGITYERPKETTETLTGQPEQNLLYYGQPGQPFSKSMLPVSQKGRNTVQAAIDQGNFESPAAQVAPSIPEQTQSPSTGILPAFTNKAGAMANKVSGALANADPMSALNGMNPANVIQSLIGAGVKGGLENSQQIQTPTDPATQSALEDLHSGRATIDELIANENELRSRGVDVDLLKRIFELPPKMPSHVIKRTSNRAN